MSIWSDLLGEAQRHADGDALDALQRLEVAAMAGQTSGLDGTLLDCAERIAQAEKKVASGTEIARMSELLTLAQFGAGSIGTGIAAIFEAPDTAPALEAVFVAKFLTELVLQRRAFPHIFPADVLRKHAIDRRDLSDPDAHPALAAILERATESATRVPGLEVGDENRELAVLMVYEKKLLAKRLNRLSADPSIDGTVDLGVWDRLKIALTLRLRKRPSP